MKRKIYLLLIAIPLLLLAATVSVFGSPLAGAGSRVITSADRAPALFDEISLQETGTITGIVTAAVGGQTVSDVNVFVYTSTTATDYVAWDRTESDGRYTVTDLVPGTYHLRFNPLFTVRLRGEYYNNRASLAEADPVVVEADQTNRIDVSLDQHPVVSGTVTSAADGQPIQGVTVQLLTDPANTETVVKSDQTDANGNYEILVEELGTYYLSFQTANILGNSPYLPEYYDDAATPAEADPITAQINQVVVADAVLTRGGTVRGSVTPDFDGSVTMFLHSSDPERPSRTTSVFSGNYHFQGLPAGTYSLEVSTAGSSYLSEYYDDKFLRAEADPIDVQLNTTRTLDIELTRGGTIHGKLTGADNGSPVAGAFVRARLAEVDLDICDEFTRLNRSVMTNAQGVYTFTGLLTGTYSLAVEAASPFHNDPPVPYLSTEQANVQVQAGAATEVNFPLARGGQIAGQVTAAGSGEPLAGIGVAVYEKIVENGSPRYRFADQPTTDDEGRYVTDGLPDGEYVIQFSANDTHHMEWHSGAATRDDAAAVSVTAGETTTVDGQLSVGGRISGVVTAEPDGAPLEFVTVRVLDAQGNLVEQRTSETNSSGAYTTMALPPGDYSVFFQPSSFQAPTNQYAFEFYGDADTFAEATPVSVSAGATRNDIDAALPFGSSITGTVVTAQGQGIQTFASLYDASGFLLTTNTTSAQFVPGEYAFSGLRPGTYYVEFQDTARLTGCMEYTTYQGSFFDQKADLASATPIEVGAGETVTGINSTLPEAEEADSDASLYLPSITR